MSIAIWLLSTCAALGEASADPDIRPDETGASADPDVGPDVPPVGATSGAGRDGAVATGFPIGAARSFSASGGSTFVADRTSTFPPLVATCIDIGVPPMGATPGAGADGLVAAGFPIVAARSFSATGGSTFVANPIGVPRIGATSGAGTDRAGATGFPIVAARSFSTTGGSTFVADRTSTFPPLLATCVWGSSDCVEKFALCRTPENQRRPAVISIATPTIAQSRIVT
jgi:hypothetical protein